MPRPTTYNSRYKNELSPRQSEVLELIGRGNTNQQIADALGITLDGAKWHVSEILAKLDVGTREEAAELWRAERRPGARLSRWARGLWPWGAVAGAMVAGVALALALGSIRSEPDRSSTPHATPTPPPPRCAGTGTIQLAGLEDDGSLLYDAVAHIPNFPCRLEGDVVLFPQNAMALPYALNIDRARVNPKLDVVVTSAAYSVAQYRWRNWCGGPTKIMWRLMAPPSGAFFFNDEVPACIATSTRSELEVVDPPVTPKAAIGYVDSCDPEQIQLAIGAQYSSGPARPRVQLDVTVHTTVACRALGDLALQVFESATQRPTAEIPLSIVVPEQGLDAPFAWTSYCGPAVQTVRVTATLGRQTTELLSDIIPSCDTFPSPGSPIPDVSPGWTN